MSARQLLLNVLVVVVLLAIGGGIAYESYQSNNYVSTANAQVSVPVVTVSALSPATVQSVPAAVGQKVAAGQAIADLSGVAAAGQTTTSTVTPGRTAKGNGAKGTAGAGATTSATQTTTTTASSPTSINAPVAGVISALDVSPGQTLLPGQAVADVSEPAQAVVVANIPETSIRNVSDGQTVDVTIDAYPGTTFTGRVKAIQPATQASLSLFPASALSGSFTKVTQLVPVVVAIDAQGYSLYNGLSAEVRIHIGSGGF